VNGQDLPLPFHFMKKAACILVIVLGMVPESEAQITPQKLISGTIEKKKWPRLGQGLSKAFRKDSLNPETSYLLSLYFLSSLNPAHHIDSSWHYMKKARSNFGKTSVKDRERLRKLPLDSLLISRLAARIDSVSFEVAKQSNSETSYQHFIDSRPTAVQRSAAVELRDELAFVEAMKLNSWAGFQAFMRKYPNSHRKQEAENRFDRLLFEDKTRDRRLSSYVDFYRRYPESPFHFVAETNIFELSTAAGTTTSFIDFIEQYPKSKWSRIARNILFRLQPDEDQGQSRFWMNDSLKRVEELNQRYWVPYYKSKLYGFFDQVGNEVFPPTFEDINEEYRCGDVRSTLLITSRGLVGRDGAVVWKGNVKSVKDLGSGFVLVGTDSSSHLLHESGFRPITNSMDDAAVLANAMLAVSKNKKWAIYSLVGRMILPFQFSDVLAFDSLLVLGKAGKKILTTPSRLARVVDQHPFKDDVVADDIRRWDAKYYWIRNSNLEGVIDSRLNFIIPLERQALRKTKFGFLRLKDGKVYVEGIRRFSRTAYKSVVENGGWLKLQNERGGEMIYDRALERLYQGDSAWFQGQLAFLSSQDSVKVLLPSGQKFSYLRSAPFQIAEYRDSASWLILDEKKRKAVYDAASGVKLFVVDADQLEAISPSQFIITRAGKKGLIQDDGKVLLPVEYDAIVTADSNSYSLLKERKFGWYDRRSRVLIKPAFERNIKPYSRNLRLGYKNTGYGFILPDGKPLGQFDWEEIQYWNDSTAWVKKNFQWMLVDVYTQKVRMDRIRDFHNITSSSTETVSIVHKENSYGVISNRRGVVVPIQYSDIVNLGNKETMLYFTERHIEEAGISVIVYYDHYGKIIRRQAMETEEFEKIYCDN
jgi:hypothetical protein